MCICINGPDTGINSLTMRNLIGLSENYYFLTEKHDHFQGRILKFFKTDFVPQQELYLILGLPLISKESNIVHSVLQYSLNFIPEFMPHVPAYV